MKLEFYRQIFEKYSDIKFNENPSSFFMRTEGRTDGLTDVDDEANIRFSQFFEIKDVLKPEFV